MLYQGLPTLEVLTEAKNYNRWIAENFYSSIQAPLLEFGSGIGNISELISSYTPLCLTDTDARMLAHLKNKFSHINDVSVDFLDITQPPPEHLVESFQTVIGINVLEHVEDDQKALFHLGNVLKPSGRLLLLVPAKKWAYTDLDKQLGHFRRYEKKELAEKLVKASFQIEKLYFFNLVGLMSWIMRDKLQRSGGLRPYQISSFDTIVPILKRVELKISMPVGISLIAIAQKK
ncbi:MAG TPA: class I SAM-dependent methyltransferase [Ktedonobacteraceae bacterium]|nr:class I SAM-dependent methyltransferase [Ktedonobacteraceae bacterium]